MKNYDDLVISPPEMDTEYALLWLMEENYADCYEPIVFSTNDETEWDSVVWIDINSTKPSWTTVQWGYQQIIAYWASLPGNDRICKYHNEIVAPAIAAIYTALDGKVDKP